jgi:hypothetical protein
MQRFHVLLGCNFKSGINFSARSRPLESLDYTTHRLRPFHSGPLSAGLIVTPSSGGFEKAANSATMTIPGIDHFQERTGLRKLMARIVYARRRAVKHPGNPCNVKSRLPHESNLIQPPVVESSRSTTVLAINTDFNMLAFVAYPLR